MGVYKNQLLIEKLLTTTSRVWVWGCTILCREEKVLIYAIHCCSSITRVSSSSSSSSSPSSSGRPCEWTLLIILYYIRQRLKSNSVSQSSTLSQLRLWSELTQTHCSALPTHRKQKWVDRKLLINKVQQATDTMTFLDLKKQ